MTCEAPIDGCITMTVEQCRVEDLGGEWSGETTPAKPSVAIDFRSIESVIIKGRRCVVYAGPSMNPTLHEPDLLWIEPYCAERVRRGDVVCFKSAENGRTIVHRVVSVRRRETGDGGPQDEIRTRGDNNPKDDLWTLRPADIIGRVTIAQRGARRRAIYGGWRGFAALRWVRLGQNLYGFGGSVPRRLYHLAAGLGPFDRLLPQACRPRVVRFVSSSHTHLKLLMGRLLAGQFDAHLGTWHVRPPFRLFVDEYDLPDPRSLPPGPRTPTPNSTYP